MPARVENLGTRPGAAEVPRDAALRQRDALEAAGASPATVFAPMLLAAGLDDKVLRQIFEDNPKRFLAFVPRA